VRKTTCQDQLTKDQLTTGLPHALIVYFLSTGLPSSLIVYFQQKNTGTSPNPVTPGPGSSTVLRLQNH
jgi:hypothetical protein